SDTWPVASSGSPANRQWMGGGIGAESDPRVISDVTPDNDWRPGTRYAQNREPPGRGFRPLIIRGRLVEPEPGQASRLFEAQTRAEKTIARVREIDPKWRRRPSAYESVEGLIRAYEADAEQAQARLHELTASELLAGKGRRPRRGATTLQERPRDGSLGDGSLKSKGMSSKESTGFPNTSRR